MEAEARNLNEAFARYIRCGIPLVTLKSAMTLDGKIPPPPAEQSVRRAGVPAGGWITGEAARAHVQIQRHQTDAIWLAWERFWPTIRCSPIAAASCGGGHCCEYRFEIAHAVRVAISAERNERRRRDE